MRKDLQDTLIRIGFSARQAEMYLCVLERSSVKVGELADALSLPRSSCYDALQELVHLGFIREETVQEQKRYIAESPRCIAQSLQASAEEARYRAELAQQHIASLELFASTTSSSDNRLRVVHAQGEEGVARVRDIFRALEGKHVLHLCGYDAFLASPLPLLQNYFEELLSQGKHIEAVHSLSRLQASLCLPSDRFSLTCIPQEIGSLPGEMFVSDDVVAFVSYTAPVQSLIIFSSEVAQLCRVVFTLAKHEAQRMQVAHPVL